MESQHALRSLTGNEYNCNNMGDNGIAKGSVVSRSSHSPVSPTSSLPKRAVISSENNSVSHNSFIPNMHFNSSTALPLDSWLAAAAAAASTTQSTLLSSASLSSFLSHPSSLYPGYLLQSSQSASEASSLMPHSMCNSSIAQMISSPLNRVNSSSTTMSVSPSASPLNLSVNGSTNESKQIHSRPSLNTSSIRNVENENLCKDISIPNFDSRNSSIVALRLRAKEHVELINQSLTIV